jgi:hypothetical protein
MVPECEDKIGREDNLGEVECQEVARVVTLWGTLPITIPTRHVTKHQATLPAMNEQPEKSASYTASSL